MVLVVMTTKSYAQSCDCASELTFARLKIEKNYAGFRDKVDQSNITSYQDHSLTFEEAAKSITDPFACATLIRNWLAYFKDGHIQLNYDRVDLGDSSEAYIRSYYSAAQSIAKWNEKKILKYLSKSDLHPVEGIWENASGSYRTAIIRNPLNRESGQFVGLVLSADSVYWMPGQVKVELAEKDNGLSADYYYRDHHPEQVEANLYGDEVLEFSGISQWKKKYPKPSKPSIVKVDPDYFRKNNQPVSPSFRQVDATTTLLTLPSFGGQYAIKIDSLIAVHLTDITAAENLIIDLRGNEGGSDFCYAPIIPILYTNPIFTDGISIYASDDNIKSWEVLLDDPKVSPAIKVRIRELVNKMRANLDGYVEVPGEEVRHDSIFSNPDRIAIIIDSSCASSTEQFILAAKQSKKVTVYGESTAGILDYANMRSVQMPNMPYKLFYATSRSGRLPDNPINQIGISPDVSLADTADWVAQVRHHLAKEKN